MKPNKFYILLLVTILICFNSSLKSQTILKTNEFSVSFADDIWNGNVVPEGQQCKRFGGLNPSTPRLKVVNIPSGTTSIVMEYCDKDYEPMDNGGHGIIGFRIPKDKRRVIIPSVPGHTTDLPDGFWIVAEHKAPGWDEAGAYLPPCSGGNDHTYAVTVKAVKQLTDESKEMEVFAHVTLILGKF